MPSIKYLVLKPKTSLPYCQHRFASKFRNWYIRLWKPDLDNLQPKPPYKHVCQIGDPVLRNPAEEVAVEAIKSEEIKKVISCMKTVMDHYKVVGLAAPQIGIPLRIIAVEFNSATLNSFSPEMRVSKDMEVCKRTIIMNPSMKIVNPHQVTFEEGCVSINGFSARVARHKEISVSGFSENAEPIVNWQVKGWLARIMQHECDHLEGKLMTDRMDPKTFQFDYWYVINTTSGKFVHRFH